MQRTLFLIPHEIGPLPVLGFGWLLSILVTGLILRTAWLFFHHRDRTPQGESGSPTPVEILMGESLFWAVAAVLVIFVFPAVELKNAYGDPVGMAVRGYGVLLVFGFLSAVALAAFRSDKLGIHSELVFSLVPWVFIGGIVGARLFYVIQYRHEYIGNSLGETLRNVLAFTEGGLVVYGSFIGGFIAFVWFTRRNKIPMLKFGDAIVPCIFLGVFFGRIGCLLNGCCYGGRCEEGWAAIRFPPITMVYQDQLANGELLGMNVDPKTGRIKSVVPDSIADELGITAGDVYESGDFDPSPFKTADPDLPAGDVQPGWVMEVSGKIHVLSPSELPKRALPVAPAQLISSLCSLVLCVALCFVARFLKPSGSLMFAGFMGYAVVRFLLEIVRVDESGQLGTSLSISQWVSLVVFALSILGLVYVYRQQKHATSAEELHAAAGSSHP